MKVKSGWRNDKWLKLEKGKNLGTTEEEDTSKKHTDLSHGTSDSHRN